MIGNISRGRVFWIFQRLGRIDLFHIVGVCDQKILKGRQERNEVRT